MMDRAVSVGDVVKLNSGGPTMTVVKRVVDDIWECTWFVDNFLHTEEISSKLFTIPHSSAPGAEYWD